MDSLKSKLPMKEKVCAALKKVAGYFLCIAMIEAMFFMFVLLS